MWKVLKCENFLAQGCAETDISKKSFIPKDESCSIDNRAVWFDPCLDLRWDSLLFWTYLNPEQAQPWKVGKHR